MCDIKDVVVNDFSLTGKEMIKTLAKTTGKVSSKNSQSFKRQVKKYIGSVKLIAS